MPPIESTHGQVATLSSPLSRAIAESSSTLGDWSRGVVTMEFLRLQQLDWIGARSILSLGRGHLTLVNLSLAGDSPMQLMLAWPEAAASQVALALLRRLSWKALGGDAPQDVLVELGNLLGNAMGKALAADFGMSWTPSNPEVRRDLSRIALLQMLETTTLGKSLLVGTINCYYAGSAHEWHLIMIPSSAMEALMANKPKMVQPDPHIVTAQPGQVQLKLG